MANAGAVATTADQHIVYNTTTGALFYDADGSDAGGAMRFAKLGTALARATNITNADFFLFA